MTYWLVSRNSAGASGVCDARLSERFEAESEDDARTVFDECVADVSLSLWMPRVRIALVCRGKVLTEWDSLDANDQRANASR